MNSELIPVDYPESSLPSNAKLYTPPREDNVVTPSMSISDLAQVDEVLVALLDQALPATAGIAKADVKANFAFPRSYYSNRLSFFQDPIHPLAGFEGGTLRFRVSRVLLSTFQLGELGEGGRPGF